MASLPLSLGLVDDCDTTVALANGRVVPHGIDLHVTTTSPTSLFRRQAQFGEFDVAEMSISTYIAMRGRSDDRFVGLPVFPRRAFRHGFIFVNANAGITQPKDLEGRRVGVAEFQQTASLWIRGILRDEYGVDTDQIVWFEGGVNEPVGAERYAVDLPERIQISRIPAGQTLDAMIQAGEIDAVIGAQRPMSFIRGTGLVQRLIPEYRAAEQAYYRSTGFFPLMHMIVMKREVYDEAAWTAVNLCDAFESAKRASDERLKRIAARACALPWLQDDVEEIARVFDSADYRPYGLAPNGRALDRMIEMSFEEGLTPQRIEKDTLFAASTHQWQPTS